MERIEKIINIDNSRSHRNGLLPFVYYGDNKISFVNKDTPNGNYGQYVCDLSIFEKDGEEYLEVDRMKYLDIIRRYSFIHKVLKNGVLVKKINFEETNITRIVCDNGTTNSSTIKENRFITDFDEIDDKILHNYTPLDINFFNEENSIYRFTKPLVGKDDKEHLRKKIEQHETLIKDDNKKFFILIQNYDDVIELNNLWINWLSVEGCDDWREKVFGGKNNDCDVSELQFYSDVNKYILGLTEVPSKYDGSLVPQYVDYFKCAEYIEWFKTNSASTMAAESLETEENEWILNNWRERGGRTKNDVSEKYGCKENDSEDYDDFYKFLKKIRPVWQSTNVFKRIGDENSNVYFKYIEPFIDVNVLINSEFDYETLYDVYEYSAKNNEFEGEVKPYSAPTSGVGSGLTKQWLCLSADTIPTMCESQLSTLRHSEAVMVSDKIFGIYSVYNKKEPESGQMFKCTKYSGSTKPEINNKQEIVCEKEYSDGFVCWVCEKVSNGISSSLKCGDGEYIKANNTEKYRNITILSCIENVVGDANNGDSYYFLSRYDNSEKSPIRPPYVSGAPVNIVTYDNGDVVYDKVFSIKPNSASTMVTVKYAKGITSGATEEESGIHYEEILSYEKCKERIPIDGVYMADVWYEKIGFDGDKVEVYSDEYNLSRKTNLARITGMEICTQWTEDGAVDAMLITRDGSEGLQEEPKYNLNLLYNRGNAAAYESHFKLSECNTLEDLENYGNNFFNL